MRRALEPDHDLIGEDEPPRDLVLGAPALLGIFVAVALVCAVCFGFGYSSAHTLHPSAARQTTAANPPPQPLGGGPTQDASGPDSTALGTENSPKPTPDAAPPAEQATPEQASASPAAATGVVHVPVTAAPEAAMAAAIPARAAAQSRPSPYAVAPRAAAVPGATQSALPPTPATTAQRSAQAAAPPSVAPATSAEPAANANVMVQIAAVTRAADAESLSQALRHDGFAATVRTSLSDSYFHVQIGPFTSMDAARAMRSRLANDGYNAFIKH